MEHPEIELRNVPHEQVSNAEASAPAHRPRQLIPSVDIIFQWIHLDTARRWARTLRMSHVIDANSKDIRDHLGALLLCLKIRFCPPGRGRA